MKITIRKLKSLISEALQQKDGAYWGTYEELDRSISAMDPDTVADRDYIDIDTGEIYLDKGQQARMSFLHPKHAEDHAAYRKIQKDLDDAEYEAEMAQLDAEEAQWAQEDAAEESRREAEINAARTEFEQAVQTFAQGALDYAGSEHEFDQIAMDMAENFFHTNPQWKIWSRLLGMSRDDMKSYVAEMAYEASLK